MAKRGKRRRSWISFKLFEFEHLKTAQIHLAFNQIFRAYKIADWSGWRSLKYEKIYMKKYQSGTDVYHSLNKYFCFYNYERLHQSLGYLTPYEVYQRTR
ncbi:MAG: hypothetical protein DRP89_08565 [Candidatus Neomarinimicrobiota bacterium]|nr:MAG: hypothetical protein DRP89_08565 [Candidatus Neomarinimicrobiota bacterium]